MSTHPSQSVPPWYAVFAAFLLLGLLATWPLVLHPFSQLPGGPHKDGLEDAYQNVWNLWWTQQALSRPTNLWVTDRFFFPEQPNLLYHTLSASNTLLVAPITLLFGPIAGFNALAWLSFGIGGLGMWLLARRYVAPWPAMLAGVVYTLSPFHMAALVSDGQLQIFAHQWLPWYIYYLLRTLQGNGRRRDAAAAGGFLVLTAYGDWYYTLFVLLFSAAALLWRLAQKRDDWSALFGRMLLLGGLFALVAGPLVGAMLAESARNEYMYIYPTDDPARLSADLLAYVVPPRLHAFWGSAPWDWGVSIQVNRRFYLGVVVTLLSLFAVIVRPALRPWGLAVCGFLLLSLGGSLRINAIDTGIALPQGLLADLPIVRLTRQPDRFNILVTLALGVTAAGGLAALTALLPQRRLRVALATLLTALVLIEYWPAPIVTRTPPLPPFLASLPPGDGALIEVPFQLELPYRDAERMLFQTSHTRPISGGYHSRAYPQPQLNLPLLRDLDAGERMPDVLAEPDDWAAMAATLGYEYIIGYKQRPLGPRNLVPAEADAFRAFVSAELGGISPLYEDDWLIAYRIPPAPAQPLLALREGWQPLEESPAGRFRWISDSASIGIYLPTAGDYTLRLRLAPADTTRTLILELPTGALPITVQPGRRDYRVRLDLPAGATILTLRSGEAPTSGEQLEGNGDTRPISLRVYWLELRGE